jgi:type IV secretion system protein TrbC
VTTTQRQLLVLAILAALLILPDVAHAGGTGMPWETPMERIVDSLTGPVAKAAGVVAIALTGLGFAFSEAGSFMRRALGIIFGLAIAFSATSFGVTFFGFSGGAAF